VNSQYWPGITLMPSLKKIVSLFLPSLLLTETFFAIKTHALPFPEFGDVPTKYVQDETDCDVIQCFKFGAVFTERFLIDLLKSLIFLKGN
jgi:hypothetical protein